MSDEGEAKTFGFLEKLAILAISSLRTPCVMRCLHVASRDTVRLPTQQHMDEEDPGDMPHRNTSHPAQNLGPGDLIKFRPHRPNEPRVVRTQRSPHPLEKILRSPHGYGTILQYLVAVSLS